MKNSILLVEDEVNLAHGLKLNLELEGYSVDWVTTLEAARKRMSAATPELVILDLMLPDGSGTKVLQEIKRKDHRQPVMILTACASDDDRITGLSLGADDYITKPFHLKELMLRVRGILKRSSWYRSPYPAEIVIGKSMLKVGQSTIEREAEKFFLTELELGLVLCLWRKRNEFVTREQILVEVWGYNPDAMTRTVDIFISRLRKLLGDDANAPRILITGRGQGYMLKVEE